MRISPTQSHASRRDQEFLTLNHASRREREKMSYNLEDWDEIEIYYQHSEALRRDREFPWSDLRLWDENKNSLDLISVFETRTRILKVAIFPWIQAWTASLFCMQFLGGCYIKCRALHFAWCSPILKWPSHVLIAWMLWFFNCCHKCHKIESFYSSD